LPRFSPRATITPLRPSTCGSCHPGKPLIPDDK
jgi:hypothetical protein